VTSFLLGYGLTKNRSKLLVTSSSFLGAMILIKPIHGNVVTKRATTYMTSNGTQRNTSD
jgi:hypothetical protein